MSFEYLESLNPEQTEAVIHKGSPLLILAGAGSGLLQKLPILFSTKKLSPGQFLQ